MSDWFHHCTEGDFVDVLQEGCWTEGLLIQEGCEYACVVTSSLQFISIPVALIAPFRSRTNQSSLSAGLDIILGEMMIIDFQQKVEASRRMLQNNYEEMVQLFAGLLPLGLAVYKSLNFGIIANHFYGDLLIEFFVYVRRMPDTYIMRIWPSFWAAELLYLSSSKSQPPLVCELFAAHISAIAAKPCPLCIVSSLCELSHYFILCGEAFKDMSWFYDERAICTAEIVSLDQFARAAEVAIDYYLRSLKGREAMDTLCLMLFADKRIPTVSPIFVTKCLNEMTPFLEFLSDIIPQKASIVNYLLSSLPRDSISFDDLFDHGLFGSGFFQYFFNSMPISSCSRLIQLSGKSQNWHSFKQRFPEFPTESSSSLEHLFERIFDFPQREDICYLLKSRKVIWVISEWMNAKQLCDRLNTLGVLWVKSKTKWLGRIPLCLLREVFLYLNI